MEERDTSGSLLGKDPTTQPWSIKPIHVSEDHQGFPKTCHVQMILACVILITAVATVAGNAAVLWLLWLRICRSTTSVSILNLATDDFTVLCLYMLALLMEKILPFDLFNLFLFKFPIIAEFCFYISGLSFLSTISLERCPLVLCPIWCRCHRPRHTSTVICALLWTLAFLLSTMKACTCTTLYSKSKYDSCLAFSLPVTTYLIILFMTLLGSSLVLLVRTLCGSHQIPMTRLRETILLTALLFTFCGLPYGINYFLVFWIPADSDDFLCYYVRASVFLSCVNILANPIIYFFIGSFRQRKCQSLKLVLQRALQDTPEGEEGGDSLPQETLEMSGSSMQQWCRASVLASDVALQ